MEVLDVQYEVRWLQAAERKTTFVEAPDAASAVAAVSKAAQALWDGRAAAFELLSVVPTKHVDQTDG
jgi:hypothetical protein